MNSMSETPRTKQLKELRLKRLAFFEKKSIPCSELSANQNGSISNLGVEATLCSNTRKNSTNPSSSENFSSNHSSGYDEKKMSTVSVAVTDGAAVNDQKFLKRKEIMKNSIKKQNGNGYMNKNLSKSQRASTDLSQRSSLEFKNEYLDGSASERHVREQESLAGQKKEKVNISLKPDSHNFKIKVMRNASPRSQQQSAADAVVDKKDVKKSSEVAAGSSGDSERCRMSLNLNGSIISNSNSSKTPRVQGGETFRIGKHDASRKVAMPQVSDSSDLGSLSSQNKSMKPLLSDSDCFNPSEIRPSGGLDVNARDQEATVGVGHSGEQTEQSGASGMHELNDFIQRVKPFQSISLETTDLQNLFKSSYSLLGSRDLKSENLYRTSSSFASKDADKDTAMTRYTSSSLSSLKSSTLPHVAHDLKSVNNNVVGLPKECVTNQTSTSSYVSQRNVNDVDDINMENFVDLLPTASVESKSTSAEAEEQSSPSLSVELVVPKFLQSVPDVGSVKRSRDAFGESSDFRSSIDQNSKLSGTDSLASGIASSLSFGSVNLELVLGKERMERLLRNILEIDGSSSLSQSSVTMTLDPSKNTDCDLTRQFEGPKKMTESGDCLLRQSQESSFNGLYNPQASLEDLGLETHRHGSGGNVAGQMLSLNSCSSSYEGARSEKTKCSFLADEIYAEAQMLKDKSSLSSSVTLITPLECSTTVEEKCQNSFDHAALPHGGQSRHGLNTTDVEEQMERNGRGGSNHSHRVSRDKDDQDLVGSDPLVGSKTKADKKERHRKCKTMNSKNDILKISKDDHMQGIRHTIQQLQNEGQKKEGDKIGGSRDGTDLVQVGCYTNHAIERYFKSMENNESKGVTLDYIVYGDRFEGCEDLGMRGISLKKQEEVDENSEHSRGADEKKDILQSAESKMASTVHVCEESKKVADISGTFRLSAKVSSFEPRLLSSKRLKEKEETPIQHMDKKSRKVSQEDHEQHLNVSNSTVPNYNVEGQNNENIVKKLDATSGNSLLTKSFGLNGRDKKPVFAPVLNVRDSEEFEYSEVGRRGMGSFGEFFRDEVSINLWGSGDVDERSSSVLQNKQLKGIIEDSITDSVNFDYTVKNKVDLPEDLKATLQLNLSRSFNIEDEPTEKQPGNGEKKSSDTEHVPREMANQLEKLSLPRSLSKTNKIQAPEKCKNHSKNYGPIEEDIVVGEVEDKDLYKAFINHLVNDSRFGRRDESTICDRNVVPKLPLNRDGYVLPKSAVRLSGKTPKVGSSKLKPVGSQSLVLGKVKVAWRENDEISASVPNAAALRQRPFSAKVKTFQDDISFDKYSKNLVLSKSVGGDPSLRSRSRRRPASAGPKSRGKVTSGDLDLVHSDDDCAALNVQEKQKRSCLPSSSILSSAQLTKSEGSGRQMFRFTSADYEKYSSLSPRIQTGELSMMTSFPDEILLQIFSFLAQSDLSRCARVCQHFFRVAMDPSLWKRIELERRMLTDNHLAAIGRKRPSSLIFIQCTGEQVTSNGLRQLFWECAESLKELSFSGCSKGHLSGESLLLHATNRCHHISHLDGSWTNLSSQGLTAFADESECLVNVCLNGCQLINDEAIQILVSRHGRSLVSLELLGLFSLTNAAVEAIGNCCQKLMNLTLGQCWKLTDTCLAQLAANIPCLENLDLRGCKQIKDQTVHQLVKNCVHLTSLSLANCPNLTDSSLAEIAVQCPGLRSLDVCGCNKLSNVGVKTLVSGCTLLEYLDLSSTAINHRSVSAIASYCNRRLRVLKINFCKQINVECLMKLVKHCKQLKKLYIYGAKGLQNVTEINRLHPNIWIEM